MQLTAQVLLLQGLLLQTAYTVGGRRERYRSGIGAVLKCFSFVGEWNDILNMYKSICYVWIQFLTMILQRRMITVQGKHCISSVNNRDVFVLKGGNITMSDLKNLQVNHSITLRQQFKYKNMNISEHPSSFSRYRIT